MSTTLLEKTRAAHEDCELFEKAAADALLDEPRTHKDNVNQAHWMNEFCEKIQERTVMLAQTYEDKDGARRNEIQDMAAKGQQLFVNFYENVREIKEYHRRFPYLVVERPEAEQMLNNLDNYDNLFSGEEGYGKFLDLHPFYQRYLNIKGIGGPEEKPPTKEKEGPLDANKDGYTERLRALALSGTKKPADYIDYLDRFFTFSEREAVRDKVYLTYVKDLFDYLVGHFRRAQPIFDIDSLIPQWEQEFQSSWASGQFVPIGWNDTDTFKEESGRWCKISQKMFANKAALEGFQKGKKFKAAKIWHETVFKEICLYEVKINRLAAFLETEIENTKDHLAAKFSRRKEELDLEGSHDSDVESSSSDEEEVRMTKENYPTGWDGNPIPFWLYKLHGLGLEYKCEICGNMSYWGPRAFEKHFQEWRHAHGMKCLRLENTKEFHHVTKIQDALELDKKLKDLRVKDVWLEDEMEECEDYDGNVMPKKTYNDLRAQGLL